MIVGEGKLKKDYQKIALENKLDLYVHFLGRIENLNNLYSNARYLVVSSKNEGFPNVILEALSNNLPVITFDCMLGTHELILDKFNGLIVENQNFETLKIAMNFLIENKELYATCKKNAFESCQKFSIEKVGKQWEELIFKVLK